MSISRRQLLASSLVSGFASAQDSDWVGAVAKRHDESVESLLSRQITDAAHEHRGNFADQYGFYNPATPSGLLDAFNTAFHHPKSKFHKNPLMLERLKLAAAYLTKTQNADGNIDLLITNFNSPPDTAFATLNVARVASIARRNGTKEVIAAVEPFLRKAARALTVGGVHTPNHRWVVCASLALINDIYPNPALVRRVDQWLAEGIDIDEDGQYDERSTVVYSPIVDTALVIAAAKLGRKELLEPVRRNLDLNFYLMHPDQEMVTEISHRQDRDQRGDIGAYWFPMHYLAVHDRNPRYGWVARQHAARRASLSQLLEFPELAGPLPDAAEPETNYEKVFRALEVARIRRGNRSATMLLRGDSRFFMLRNGGVVINGVRFASAFFGKGQFIPSQWNKDGASYVFRQTLSGPYYQPLDPPVPVHVGEWGRMRAQRKQTEVGTLVQTARVTETKAGFQVRMQASGTAGVPVAIEIGIRGKEGLQMDGLLRAPGVEDGFILPAGQARLRAGGSEIRFGPGKQAHQYTAVRGAESKLPGASVYITGFTPFDHAIEFECL